MSDFPAIRSQAPVATSTVDEYRTSLSCCSLFRERQSTACVRLPLRSSAIDDLMPSVGRISHQSSSLACETTDTEIAICAVLING